MSASTTTPPIWSRPLRLDDDPRAIVVALCAAVLDDEARVEDGGRYVGEIYGGRAVFVRWDVASWAPLGEVDACARCLQDAADGSLQGLSTATRLSILARMLGALAIIAVPSREATALVGMLAEQVRDQMRVGR